MLRHHVSLWYRYVALFPAILGYRQIVRATRYKLFIRVRQHSYASVGEQEERSRLIPRRTFSFLYIFFLQYFFSPPTLPFFFFLFFVLEEEYRHIASYRTPALAVIAVRVRETSPRVLVSSRERAPLFIHRYSKVRGYAMSYVSTSTRPAVRSSSSSSSLRNILFLNAPCRQQRNRHAQCGAGQPLFSTRVHSLRRDARRDAGVRVRFSSNPRVVGRSRARDGTGMRMSASLKEETDTADPTSSSSSSSFYVYSPPPATPQRLRRAGVVASLAVMGIAAGEFGLLALDLSTTHVLASHVDVVVHQSVLASTSEVVRTNVAPRVISDIFPTLGFGCLVGSTVRTKVYKHCRLLYCIYILKYTVT